MLLRTFSLAIGLFMLAGCGIKPTPTQTFGSLTLSPWSWALINCAGCEYTDSFNNTNVGRSQHTEARRAGKIVVLASVGDRGGEIFPGVTLSPRSNQGDSWLNLRFANSYQDAEVKVRTEFVDGLTVKPGQQVPLKLNGEAWTLYLVRATEWQDDDKGSEFLLDWALVKN